MLRRRLRSNEKSFSSSSSCSEPEDETELKTLLAQSKSRLENTDALRIRHHLLRPEDYVRFENISTNCVRDDMDEQSDSGCEFAIDDSASETLDPCANEISSSEACDAISKCVSERRLRFNFRDFEQKHVVFALNLFGFVALLFEVMSDFLSS